MTIIEDRLSILDSLELKEGGHRDFELLDAMIAVGQEAA